MGRPWIYKTPEELEEKIEAYFTECEGEIVYTRDGEMLLDKYGQPVVRGAHPPTVTGLALALTGLTELRRASVLTLSGGELQRVLLALALGFGGRQALMNYQGREVFKDTITRAKARCEEYAERRLYDKDGCTGAKFSLACNWGWREKAEEAEDKTLEVVGLPEEYKR